MVRRAGAASGEANNLAKHCRGFTEIEEQARRLRQRVGIDELMCPDLIDIFQKLPEVFPGLRLVPVSNDELPHCEAEADCVRKVISVRQSVYDACLEGEPRARMTLAHELGHIALGHTGIRYRKTGEMYRGPVDRRVRHEESEAKQFAAVFLAPTYLARECKSIEEIGEKFGISDEAANIRFGQVAEARQQVSPAQRWKSAEKKREQSGTAEDLSDKSGSSSSREGRRDLPPKVVDYLEQAERRGHRISSLRKRDDSD